MVVLSTCGPFSRLKKKRKRFQTDVLEGCEDRATTARRSVAQHRGWKNSSPTLHSRHKTRLRLKAHPHMDILTIAHTRPLRFPFSYNKLTSSFCAVESKPPIALLTTCNRCVEQQLSFVSHSFRLIPPSPALAEFRIQNPPYPLQPTNPIFKTFLFRIQIQENGDAGRWRHRLKLEKFCRDPTVISSIVEDGTVI